VKLPVIFHKDGRQAFIDVRPYRDWLRTVDPVQFEAWAQEEREWAAVTWLDGFFSPEPYGHKNDFRWGQKRGTAAVVNPADRTRKFELAVTFGVDAPGEFLIRIDGGGLTQLNKPGGPGPWAEEFTVTKPDPPTGAHRDGANPDRRTYLLEVPPGRHLVTFRCTVPDKFMPGEARPLCYYLRDITFREIK
jgi:hypothetical protein